MSLVETAYFVLPFASLTALRKVEKGPQLIVVSVALLGKWGWDLANSQDQFWARILMSKYGGWNALCYGRNRADSSPWWKDLRYVFQ